MLIAGGIGITPMMAVVRSLCDRAWRGDMYLMLSVRRAEDIVFRDELAYLQARFPNLHVAITVTSDEASDDVQRGRLTREGIRYGGLRERLLDHRGQVADDQLTQLTRVRVRRAYARTRRQYSLLQRGEQVEGVAEFLRHVSSSWAIGPPPSRRTVSYRRVLQVSACFVVAQCLNCSAEKKSKQERFGIVREMYIVPLVAL